MKKIIFSLLLMFLSISFVYSAELNDEEIPLLSVSVENAVFSPIAHLHEGVIFIPELINIKRIKEWVLTIKNDLGKEVAVLKGKREIPKQIVWDAFTSKGKYVEDGKYSYELVLDEGDRVYLVNGNDIIIDTIPPIISINLTDDIYFLDPQTKKVSNEISFNVICQSEIEIDYSRSFLTVINFNSKEVKAFNFQDQVSQPFVWDGIDDTYNIPLPAGSYKITLTVFDIAGNSSQAIAEFLIVSQAAKPEEKEDSNQEKETVQNPQQEKSSVSVKEEAAKGKKQSQVSALAKQQNPYTISFDSARSELSENAKEKLKQTANILKANKNNIKIDGYFDATDEERSIKNLAANRAEAARNFFIKEGISASRIKVLWHPAPKKAAPKNRKVKITILKDNEK